MLVSVHVPAVLQASSYSVSTNVQFEKLQLPRHSVPTSASSPMALGYLRALVRYAVALPTPPGEGEDQTKPQNESPGFVQLQL